MIAYAVPIYADKGKSLAHYIGYITNPAKVLPESDYPCYTLQKELSSGMLQTTIVAADGHIKATYVSGYMTTPEELKERVEHLWDVYKSYQGSARGDEGPIAYHIVISAALNESVSDEEMHLIAAELVEALGAYPGIFATHIRPVWDDRFGGWRGFTKHDHLIVSAFPDVFHGMPKKLALGFHYERLRAIADRIAIKHGLQIVVDADRGRADSYYAVMQAKRGDSWLEKARDEIAALVEESADRADYEKLLVKQGYGLQQIGPDLLYSIPDGHTVMGHRLGREYSLECLEARWAARKEGAIDEELSQAKDEHGTLYVKIPLGGRFKDPTTMYRCKLQTLAVTYREASLRSYFQSGCMYDITDEAGRLIRRAEGLQILGYLGVDGAAWESGLEAEVRKRRLEWHLKRLEGEMDRHCEQYTECAALRYDYQCRWRHEHAAPRNENQVYYGPNWALWSKKSGLEILVLMLLEDLIPSFDSGLWIKRIVVDNRAAVENLQRHMDAYAIVREEEIGSLRELEMRTHAAETLYDRLAEEVAEVDLQLEDFRPLLTAMRECREKREAFDSCCARADSFETLRQSYPDVVTAYEEAVSAVGQEAMQRLGDIDRIMNYCRMLDERRAMLKQALAAEYERKRKLELAQYMYGAYGYLGRGSKSLSEEEWASILAQEPKGADAAGDVVFGDDKPERKPDVIKPLTKPDEGCEEPTPQAGAPKAQGQPQRPQSRSFDTLVAKAKAEAEARARAEGKSTSSTEKERDQGR